MEKGRKKTNNSTREDKKHQLLNFIEKKKTQSISSDAQNIVFQKNRKEQNLHLNEENMSGETGKTQIEGSNRRKKRREKLQELREKREDIKKQRALSVLQKKQKKEEERRRKKEEIQQRKLEALKKREEANRLKESEKTEKPVVLSKEVLNNDVGPKEKQLIVPTATSAQIDKKQQLLEFIKARNILKKEELERKKILKQIAIEKKKIKKTSGEDKKEISIPAEIPVKITPQEIIPKEVTPKEVVPVVLSEAIVSQTSDVPEESSSIEKEVKSDTPISIKNKKRFLPIFAKKKKEEIQKPVSAISEKKTVVKYKEPFLLMPFIRRNIFKFIFLILLLIWIYEILFFMRGLEGSRERLAKLIDKKTFKQETDVLPSEEEKLPITGQELKEEKLPVTEQELKIALKREKINIEGERDPFSPGRLTMKVLEKPEAKNIVLALKPSVISILRPSKDVSILKEEKQIEPENLSPISKSQIPAYQTILKDKTTEPALIMAEKRPNLTYRGRMVIEGIEYLFIEGENKTYRVTIGDVVEGFRILKKEKQILTLSKEGIIYEISAD